MRPRLARRPSGAPAHARRRPGSHLSRGIHHIRAAFTLIELLVVIAVIGLLLGILMPALGQARESAMATVCQSNMRQIAMAVVSYAADFDDQVWPQFEWVPVKYSIQTPGQPAQQDVGDGVLFTYLENVHHIVECPKARRQSKTGKEQVNPWGTYTGVAFDYTMIGRFQGIRLAASTRVGILNNNAGYGAGAKPPLKVLDGPGKFDILNGIPIFVEESLYFHNDGVTDGLWGNQDQVSDRHRKRGHVSYLDGHVEEFIVKSGYDPIKNEKEDFDCNDLYVKLVGKNWIRLEPTDTNNATNWQQRPFGWANYPK